MQVSHVRREGNKPAHILVQYAKDLVSYVTWVNKDPIIIESVLTYNVLRQQVMSPMPKSSNNGIVICGVLLHSVIRLLTEISKGDALD